MSNLFKRIRKILDRDLKVNRKTLQSPSTEQNMIEVGRDLTIYDGTFNQVNGTLNQIQVNHDNRGSGMLASYDAFMTR